MFDLKPEIKRVLLDMEFVSQFEKLSGQYTADLVSFDERLRDIDVNKVIQIIKEMGYHTSYDKKEKFFHIEFAQVNSPDCRFNVNVAIREGRVELTWEVYYKGEVRLGSPWTVYSRILAAPNYRISFPVVQSYEELKEVLQTNFDMFTMFQDLLLKYYKQEEV